MTRTLLGAACLIAVLQGCTTAPPREYAPGTSPAGPVFLVHGIWPDSEDWWMDDVEEALQRRGIEAVGVPYSAFVLEYLTGIGTERPAERPAAFAVELEKRHARTACPAPLRFAGIGYSAGTVVLLRTAERGVRFDRVYLAGSPLPFWTSMPDDLGRIVNYYSPLDGLVWLSMGSGQFGLSCADENRLHWRGHLCPLYDDAGTVDTIIAEIVSAGGGPTHTCFQDAGYREWYQETKRKSRAGR